jgi:4-carboxymuconolactone decarboxylase
MNTLAQDSAHEGRAPTPRPERFPAPGAKPTFDRGLQLREQVLGTEYVQRSLQQADDFTQPLQQLITEYCWGEVWGSEALDKRTRSLLNIAMLTALNRKDELKLHTRGALTNGATVAEIQAVLMQACIYCGVPAALDSSKAVREALKEAGAL